MIEKKRTISQGKLDINLIARLHEHTTTFFILSSAPIIWDIIFLNCFKQFCFPAYYLRQRLIQFFFWLRNMSSVFLFFSVFSPYALWTKSSRLTLSKFILCCGISSKIKCTQVIKHWTFYINCLVFNQDSSKLMVNDIVSKKQLFCFFKNVKFILKACQTKSNKL